MSIVVVDSDASARENIKVLLSIYAPGSQIVGEADGVSSGLACIRKKQPDLVLLDVAMKDGSGFDIISSHDRPDFKFIFITKHNEYAIKAFKYSAIDYILKPIDPLDLQTALLKAGTVSQHHKQEQNLKIANLVQNHQSSYSEKKILLKDLDTIYLVSVQDIIRCESQANYTQFFLTDGRKIMVCKTLKEYHQFLEDQTFFRAHQSHLINLQHFDRYEKRDGGIVHMKDGSVLPVAVRKKEALMSALESM